jgi:hypothetical protein
MSKLFVPPIVVPALLVIAILGYGLLRGSTTAPDVPAVVLNTSLPVSK